MELLAPLRLLCESPLALLLERNLPLSLLFGARRRVIPAAEDGIDQRRPQHAGELIQRSREATSDAAASRARPGTQHVDVTLVVAEPIGGAHDRDAARAMPRDALRVRAWRHHQQERDPRLHRPDAEVALSSQTITFSRASLASAASGTSAR